MFPLITCSTPSNASIPHCPFSEHTLSLEPRRHDHVALEQGCRCASSVRPMTWLSATSSETRQRHLDSPYCIAGPAVATTAIERYDCSEDRIVPHLVFSDSSCMTAIELGVRMSNKQEALVVAVLSLCTSRTCTSVASELPSHQLQKRTCHRVA